MRIGGAELSNVFGLQLQQLWVQPAASVETWSAGQLDNQDLGPTDGGSSALRKEKGSVANSLKPLVSSGSRFTTVHDKKYLGSVLDVGKIPSES